MVERCGNCNHDATVQFSKASAKLCREAVDLLREWHIAGGVTCPEMVERLVAMGHARISRDRAWRQSRDPQVRNAIHRCEDDSAARGFGQRARRLKVLNRMVDDLLRVIELRKTTYASACGGETGLVVVQETRVGSGSGARVVTKETVDYMVINQLRGLLEQIRAEAGRTVVTRNESANENEVGTKLDPATRLRIAEGIMSKIQRLKDAVTASGGDVEAILSG